MPKNNQITETSHKSFEAIKRTDQIDGEYWSARDLANVLQYSDYRNFLSVISKAKKACEKSGHEIDDHFGDINEMVELGSGAQRKVLSCHLSRYACYLIIQNADPSKEIVAVGQTYFATQTRKQEISEQETKNQKRMMLRDEMNIHNKKLASAARESGVIQPMDYAIFQNHGYQGLYGGMKQKDIHEHKGLKKSQKILDHMGSTELAANLFRATQTEEKLRREDIKGKRAANKVHHDVGKKVRKTIKEIGGTMPEDLPPEESIKKVERQEQKRLVKKKEDT